MTYVEQAIYRERDLEVYRMRQKKTGLGFDFIRVQECPVNELLSETLGDSEISALREQNDVLNQMNEDAIDALKFDMFGMWAITNAAPGSADGLDIAPGA